MTQLRLVSEALGDKRLVCTEVGFQSRPWAYSGYTSQFRNGLSNSLYLHNHELSPRDCTQPGLCASEVAQALAYQGMFARLYAEPWFGGFYLWLWRADPTAGGPTDDSFTPKGKLTAQVIKKWWQ